MGQDENYHAAVDTNNGVESMNKTLKYNYLPKGKNITLSHLVTILVEDFLPEAFQKYQKENFAMTESYRTYNQFVPDYLRGRPRKVILHCLSRKQKAAKFTKESIKMADQPGMFIVNSASGKEHKVQFVADDNMPQCTCKDWIRWHIPCKHFQAVFTHFSQWGWASLPKSYLESEYISIDPVALCQPPLDGTPQDPDCGELGNCLEGEETDNIQLPLRNVSQMFLMYMYLTIFLQHSSSTNKAR